MLVSWHAVWKIQRQREGRVGEREIESRERNGYSYARKFCEFGESEGDRCLRRSLVARPPDPGLLRMCDAEVWNGSVGCAAGKRSARAVLWWISAQGNACFYVWCGAFLQAGGLLECGLWLWYWQVWRCVPAPGGHGRCEE